MSSIQSVIIRFLLRRADIWNRPLEEVRHGLEKIKKAAGAPAGIRAEKTEMNGLSFEAFRHEAKKHDSVILYFHGGGFCIGIYHPNREFVARLAELTEMDVYMPDYRLAPEHPFPAALEDAVAAYQGLVQKGHAESDILIMGDSSGCALALSALLALKQKGEKMPRALAFITPVFDLTGSGASFITRARKDPFRLEDPLGIAKGYLGANDAASPLISPLFGDLEGLPPMFIHGADYDVFLSDAERLADRAKNAGVQVEMKVWEHMWHIFHMQAAVVPESRQAMNELCGFCRGTDCC